MRYSFFATFSALLLLASAYPTAAPNSNLITERSRIAGDKLNSHVVALPHAKLRRGLLGDVTDDLKEEWDNVEDDLKNLPDAIKSELATKKSRGFFDDIKDHGEDLWEKAKEGAEQVKDGIKSELGV